MIYIVFVVGAITTLMFVLLLFYIIFKKHEQKKIKKKREDYVSSMMKNDIESLSLVKDHIGRTYVFYYSYVIHTALNMFCKIMGLIFSVASFAMQVLSDVCGKNYDQITKCYHPLMGISISFLAVIFVIIIVYVKPHKKAAQYLITWRSMNNHYYQLLVDCGILKSALTSEIDFLNNAEHSLIDDVDD